MHFRYFPIEIAISKYLTLDEAKNIEIQTAERLEL